MATVRDRLTEAAFELFDERGFEATTADDVANRAGLGRTTFFRSFRSKEDVIFPDHDVVLQAVRARLDTATSSTALMAVTEAARLVMNHYLNEGNRARVRYRLTRSVPALRDREVASQQQYQDTFRAFLHQWMGGAHDTALRSELMANAAVTAHNHVLRRWLRGTTDAAEAELEFTRAMADVIGLFERAHSPEGEASFVVLRTTRTLAEVMPALLQIGDPITNSPTPDRQQPSPERA